MVEKYHRNHLPHLRENQSRTFEFKPFRPWSVPGPKVVFLVENFIDIGCVSGPISPFPNQIVLVAKKGREDRQKILTRLGDMRNILCISSEVCVHFEESCVISVAPYFKKCEIISPERERAL